MNWLKNIRGSRSICKFKLVKWFLGNLKFVALLKVLDGDVMEDFAHLVVIIFVLEISFHVLLDKFRYVFFEITGFNALIPLIGINCDLFETLWNFPILQVVKQRIGIKKARFQKIEFGSQPFSEAQVGRIIIKKFISTFPQVVNLIDLKLHLL